MRITKINLTLGLAAALLAAGTTYAQGPGGDGFGMGPHRPPMERAMGPRGDHGRWWNEPRIVDKFKLTDTQRKAMDDIYQQHRLSLVDLHATLEKAELSLEPLMGEDQPDEAKILQQIDHVAQARAELEKANARMLLDLRKQLTPEQWKQLRTDRQSHRDGGPGEHMQGRRWGGGPNGGPNGGPKGQPGSAPPPGAAPGGPGGEDE